MVAESNARLSITKPQVAGVVSHKRIKGVTALNKIK